MKGDKQHGKDSAKRPGPDGQPAQSRGISQRKAIAMGSDRQAKGDHRPHAGAGRKK